MKFLSERGDEVFYASAMKPPIDGRMIHNPAGLRRARDLAWVVLAKDGWSSVEIAETFGFSHTHVLNRIRELTEAKNLDFDWIRRPKNKGVSKQNAIRQMASAGYTELDLAEIWRLEPKQIRKLIKVG